MRSKPPEGDGTPIVLSQKVKRSLSLRHALSWAVALLLLGCVLLSGSILLVANREVFTPSESMYEAKLLSRGTELARNREGCFYAVRYDDSAAIGKATCFIQYQHSDSHGRITAAWQTSYRLRSHECRRVHAVYHQRRCGDVKYPSESLIRSIVDD